MVLFPEPAFAAHGREVLIGILKPTSAEESACTPDISGELSCKNVAWAGFAGFNCTDTTMVGVRL